MSNEAGARRGKLVVTTAITGCEDKLYLKQFCEDCKKRGKLVKVYSVGEMIVDLAKQRGFSHNPAKILNTRQHTILALRIAVFREIINQLPNDLVNYDAVIISAHSVFWWKGAFIHANLEKDIMELCDHGFRPDMFITFIDAGEDILENLNKRPIWQEQDITEQVILLWQNVEVNNTRAFTNWLNMGHRSFFALPIKQPTKTLYGLIFEPEIPVVYAQMPITHLNRSELKKVRRFIDKLREYFIVFDPLTIETGKVKMSCEDGEVHTRHLQTVYRDLYWFLGQADMSIAYIVKPVFTPGVIDELREAYDSAKDTMVVFPGHQSPFLAFLAFKKIFSTPQDLFEYIEKHFSKRKC